MKKNREKAAWAGFITEAAFQAKRCLEAQKSNLFHSDILTNPQTQSNTREVSSMMHSARPIVTPVANIVFYCFVFLDLKIGDVRTYGWTYGQHVRKQLSLPAVTLGWPSGSIYLAVHSTDDVDKSYFEFRNF